MNFYRTKFLISAFILLAFMSIGVFGLLQLNPMSNHVSEEAPMANCPYAENSYSVCQNGFDHINNWRQFSNTVLPSLLIFSVLILGVILYFLNRQNYLRQIALLFRKWKIYLDNKKLLSSPDKIIKWLSLFENSPSLKF